MNTTTGAIVTVDGGGTATTFSFAAGTYGGLSVVSIDEVLTEIHLGLMEFNSNFGGFLYAINYGSCCESS